jgi:hypothetical protein
MKWGWWVVVIGVMMWWGSLGMKKARAWAAKDRLMRFSFFVSLGVPTITCNLTTL